jgi:CheY-like chemotaxis protein
MILLHIGVEIALAIATVFASQTCWQMLKRRRFMARIFPLQHFWEEFLTAEKLNDSSAYVARITRESELGFVENIRLEAFAEVGVHRRVMLIAGTAMGIILVGGWALGSVYMVINVSLGVITAFEPLCRSARASATQHGLTLAIILHKWRKKDAAECDAWIDQTWSLRPLYEAVKNVSERPARPRQIVIVDDEEWLCEMYCLLLREWFPGVSINCFQDGLQAWDHLAQDDPDLLIMDINRTGMDGIETLRRLAALRKAYPVLVASGCLSSDVEKVARSVAGPLRVALHSKPWTVEQLHGEVLRLLGREVGTEQLI